MDRIRRFIVTNLWWLALLVALAMLICHTLDVKRVIVDNTSLILVALVLISPFVAAIKKVKIGDFEAEIRPDEVMRVAKQVEESLPDILPSNDVLTPETSEVVTAIHELAETDPVVALAKLRIELESRLRRLERHLDRPTRKSPTPLSLIIRKLVSQQVFTAEFGSSLWEVISICNRTIHGEGIRDVDARQIINTGTELLEVLDQKVRNYMATHALETTVITPQERDQLAAAQYRLKTIVPFKENPERREYVLNQQELDAFFENYSEFAEFLIELVQVP